MRISYHALDNNTADVEISLPFTHAFNSPEEMYERSKGNLKLKWLPNDFLILRFPNHSSSARLSNPTSDVRLAVATISTSSPS